MTTLPAASLSTFQVPGSDLVTVLNDADRVRDAVLWLGLSTYRVDHDDMAGVRVVLGKVSSSRGLYLDPARISKMAAGSSWVAVATHVDPVAVAVALRDLDVEVREQAENVKSVGSVSLEAAVDVARRAGGHIRVEAPVGDVVIDDIDLTDLFQEAGCQNDEVTSVKSVGAVSLEAAGSGRTRRGHRRGRTSSSASLEEAV